MLDHIHNSNLIENIDDPKEDDQSMLAWEYISKQPDIAMGQLLETHKIITKNQLAINEAGNFRVVHVWVGGRATPTPFMAMQLVYNLLLDLMQRPNEIDPKEAHVRFEYAHPFIDGNGRTGRMLMWWHEQKIGQEPSLIPIEKRQDYYQWFKEQ